MPPAVAIALAVLVVLIVLALFRQSGGGRAASLIQQQLIELRARFDQLVAAQQEVPKALAQGSAAQASLLSDVRERLGALSEATRRLETMGATVTEVQQLLQVPKLRHDRRDVAGRAAAPDPPRVALRDAACVQVR